MLHSPEQLRGEVAGGAAHVVQPLPGLQQLGEPEVGELDVVVLVQQDVLGLDVAVHHAHAVTVLQGI